MNSNYTDTNFTRNIYTSLRSKRLLTSCLTLQCPKKTLVNTQYETVKTDQLNMSRSSTAMGGHFTGRSCAEYTGGNQLLCRRDNHSTPLWSRHHMQQPHRFLRVYWGVLPTNNQS